jgi:hypothetical protein
MAVVPRSEDPVDDVERQKEGGPRRLWLVAVAVAVVLMLAAYVLSPLVAALRFVDAVQRGDAAAVSAAVDFPALRRSIARQIVGDQVRERNLRGIEAQIAAGVGARSVAAWLEEILTPASVIELVNGRLPAAAGQPAGAPLDIRAMTAAGAAGAFAVWRASGFTGFDSYRVVPRPSAGDDGTVLDMGLSTSGWKLVGVRLPPAVRASIARRAEEISRQPR